MRYLFQTCLSCWVECVFCLRVMLSIYGTFLLPCRIKPWAPGKRIRLPWFRSILRGMSSPCAVRFNAQFNFTESNNEWLIGDNFDWTKQWFDDRICLGVLVIILSSKPPVVFHSATNLPCEGAHVTCMIRFAHGAVHVSREHSISQYISMNPFAQAFLRGFLIPRVQGNPLPHPSETLMGMAWRVRVRVRQVYELVTFPKFRCSGTHNFTVTFKKLMSRWKLSVQQVAHRFRRYTNYLLEREPGAPGFLWGIQNRCAWQIWQVLHIVDDLGRSNRHYKPRYVF